MNRADQPQVAGVVVPREGVLLRCGEGAVQLGWVPFAMGGVFCLRRRIFPGFSDSLLWVAKRGLDDFAKLEEVTRVADTASRTADSRMRNTLSMSII